jgi:hypothetical protein
MSRPAVAIVLSVLLVFAVAAAQWRLTSPGVVTDAEFRLLALASVPALVTILSAYWVDAGRRNREDWR